ncbi:hypothetical protein ACJJTC_000541 [Scirpophaga incertulas]
MMIGDDWNELEILGIPEQKNENLTHLVLVTATKLGVNLQEADLDDIHRVGHLNSEQPSSGSLKTRPIVVKFLRKIKKNEVLSAYKVRRNLTSEDIKPGSSNRIYINERLTVMKRQLFREARVRAKDNNFQYCWVRNGTIFIRRAADSNGKKFPAIPIRCHEDINTHLGQTQIHTSYD